MSKQLDFFREIISKIPEAKESKMFGAICFKAPNGKAVAMIWKDEIIVKLDNDHEKKALQLKGAHVFTPMEGRPMNGWIQIPYAHAKEWLKYAEIAMEKVKLIEPKIKTPKKTKAPKSSSKKSSVKSTKK